MELLLLSPLSGAPSNFSEKWGLCSWGEGWLRPAGFGWCAPSPEIPLQSHNWGGKAGPWPAGLLHHLLTLLGTTVCTFYLYEHAIKPSGFYD